MNILGAGIEGMLQLIPVYAAHRVIADTLASSDLTCYRAGVGGVSTVLERQPQMLTTPPYGLSVATWITQCVTSLLGRGNAFGIVLATGPDGWPTQLYWANPDEIQVIEPYPGKLWADYFWLGKRLNPGEFLHIPWITQPGKVKGLSPIAAFKSMVETGASAQDQAKEWYAGGMVPVMHMKSTNDLNASDVTDAKNKYKAVVRSRSDILVTGNDWSLTPLSLPPDEARFLETMRLTATQVATIYGLPPELIGGETAGGSLEYKTVEGNEIRLRGALHPWAVRIEQGLGQLTPRGQFARFDLDGSVRTDLITRMNAHILAQRAGVETLEESRRAENRPPLTPAELSRWMSLNQKPPDAGKVA